LTAPSCGSLPEYIIALYKYILNFNFKDGVILNSARSANSAVSTE